MDEKLIGIAQRAKMSEALLLHLVPIVEQQSKDIVEKIKAQYRQGKLDPSKIHSYLGELCALEDLVIGLKASFNRGKSLQGELLNA